MKRGGGNITTFNLRFTGDPGNTMFSYTTPEDILTEINLNNSELWNTYYGGEAHPFSIRSGTSINITLATGYEMIHWGEGDYNKIAESTTTYSYSPKANEYLWLFIQVD